MNAFRRLTRPRVLWTLLALSVAMNLFLGGMLSGRVGARVLHPMLFERDVEGHLGFVSRARRAELRRNLLPPEPTMRAYHREMHALRQTLADELAHEPPRRQPIENGLAALRTLNMEMQQQLHQRFIETVLTLPAAERQAMMEALLQPGRRGGPARRFDTHPRHEPPTGSGTATRTRPPLPSPDAGHR